MSGDQLDKVEKGVRFFMQPLFIGLVTLITSVFWGTVISLIAAAFLKRPAPMQNASVAEPPPLV